jgi:KDO2-lipid IV(A) lauroyltransferase
MKDFIVARAYFLGWTLIRRIPEKSATNLFAWLGSRMLKKNGKSVKRLRSNLARVNPSLQLEELQDLTAQGVMSYMRYWRETFRSPDWSREKILSTVTVSNEHLLMDPVNSENPPVQTCPECKKGVMVIRTGQYGPFLGCSTFPKCIKRLPFIRPQVTIRDSPQGD